ncbi:hypothetical protein EDEG_00178 [Edhazardia aedis USNM 41457]|uniref:Uncharacterized protein n=1 Tax=Edhazardia aedis (strain USNM 41457) TaxID=1003232 RepID=J9DM67_EDHAE|nr:hypothetical protein EDEG_00178 [Edhazardia aedis USNM 41457]|eukprot:EJW03690.1 hypothetical protein EDEG_00178 [Edhazardia aedis USNM 41457]
MLLFSLILNAKMSKHNNSFIQIGCFEIVCYKYSIPRNIFYYVFNHIYVTTSLNHYICPSLNIFYHKKTFSKLFIKKVELNQVKIEQLSRMERKRRRINRVRKSTAILHMYISIRCFEHPIYRYFFHFFYFSYQILEIS